MLQWRRLRRRIARRHCRYERNKIFVHHLHGAEMLITTLMYNPYLGIPVGALIILAFFTPRLASWGMIAAGGAGLAWAGVLTWTVLVYERRHGALYYQYDSDTWGGAEGMLYQHGTVVDCLAPDGKVKMAGGVLWNAVSISGETIAVGEVVEVIALRGLTLYVDPYHEPPSGEK
jgi:membrane-bound ClpP family serine protease